MLEKTAIIKVMNRDNGTVGYTIPDLNNLHRNFQPKEEKEVTMEELRKLSYLPGGETIIRDCLIIENEEALKELLSNVEPEYFYTEEDIKTLLTSGTIDQFMDCLDFAPTGVIDLVKDLAVKMEINDIRKRQAILEKTGFNVDKAIQINKETSEEEAPAEKTRRAQPISANATNADTNTGRKTAPPKYKVTVQK